MAGWSGSLRWIMSIIKLSSYKNCEEKFKDHNFYRRRIYYGMKMQCQVIFSSSILGLWFSSRLNFHLVVAYLKGAKKKGASKQRLTYLRRLTYHSYVRRVIADTTYLSQLCLFYERRGIAVTTYLSQLCLFYVRRFREVITFLLKTVT